jgi:hypothetical protein
MAMSTPTRWAELGKIGDTFAEESESLLKRGHRGVGPYQTRRHNGTISFALRLPFGGNTQFIQPSKWMDNSTINQFSLGNITHSMGIQELDKTILGQDTLNDLLRKMTESEGIQRYEVIRKLIFYCSLEQLSHILPKAIAPEFYKWYPKGRILFLSGVPELHEALAALRVMGAAVDIADRDYDHLKRIGNIKMLEDLQSAGIFCSSKHLSIPIAMLLPKLYGFTAGKVLLGFLFLLDEPIPEVRQNYPRSGLEFVRSDATPLFHQAIDARVEDITPDLVDKFALIDHKFTSSDIRKFVSQYITHLNGLASYLLDPSNFKNQQTNKWIGLAHYRAWLSFERITDEVIFMLTDDNAFLRKMSLFRIFDQLAGLVTEENSALAEVFKQFLLPTGKDDLIADGLRAYDGEVGKHLVQNLQSARIELRKIVLDSVYIPGKVDKNASTVTIDDSTVVSADEYVVGMVREIRNTYHGYYTNHFDKFLAISTGNTPDSLPVLGVLAYLAFLAKPKIFIGRTWD